MNKIFGFMNVVLLALLIVLLLVGANGFDQKHVVLGTVLIFVPITFTMLALEPQARFVRTAIVTNVLFVVTYFFGSGSPIFSPQNVIVLPFVLNIAALTRIWFRVRHEEREAAYEPAGLQSPGDDRPGRPGVLERAVYPDQPAENYFVRHWRGQLSLPMSYWVNTWCATAICAGLIFAVDQLLDDASLRAQAAAALSLQVLFLGVGIWSIVGTWRSAGYHSSRGGARGWAITAQILVVLGAVGTVSNFFLYTLPQTKEYWLIALDRDSLGIIEAKLTRDTRAVVLSGTFGTGSASKVRSVLDQAPGINTVVLESSGGRVTEAVRIARLVRERKLSTYVEDHCESACTLVFLAGVDRAMTPHAQIGFHRAFFPGMNPELDAAMTKGMLQHYRAAGLSDEFLVRVSDTKADDMWYPTRQELLEAQVVERISLGGETARSIKYDSKAYLAFQYAGDPIMSAINDRFHGAVDAAAAAAWEVYERGASDAQMWAAARKVILGYYRKLLTTADEPSLRAYLQIRLDQLRVARNVSEEACALLANSSLDIGQALPRDLYERELTWVQRAIATSGQAPMSAVDPQQLDEVTKRMVERLSPEVPEVIRDPAAHANQPQLLCRATLEFYETLRALPLTERTIVMRGHFQAPTGGAS